MLRYYERKIISHTYARAQRSDDSRSQIQMHERLVPTSWFGKVPARLVVRKNDSFRDPRLSTYKDKYITAVVISARNKAL